MMMVTKQQEQVKILTIKLISRPKIEQVQAKKSPMGPDNIRILTKISLKM